MPELWAVSIVVLWIVVSAMAFLLAGALRQLGLIALRLGDDPGALITDAGLDRGSLLPEVAAIDSESGELRQVSDLFGPRHRMMVFLAPTCLSCRQLVGHLNEVMATHSGEYDFLTICRGDLESCRGFKRVNRLDGDMLVDTTGEVNSGFDVRFTPFAYVIDSQNRVLIRGVVNDWRQLESLLNQEGTLQPGDFDVASGPLQHETSERISVS